MASDGSEHLAEGLNVESRIDLVGQAEQDVFPGCPELKDGMLWANDKPGLGVDLDEALAAKFPIRDDPPFDLHWGNLRRRDGSITKP